MTRRWVLAVVSAALASCAKPAIKDPALQQAVAASAAPKEVDQMAPPEQLKRLAADYWNYVLLTEPTMATNIYQEEYPHNDRLPDVGPERRAADVEAMEVFLARLNEIEADNLGDADRVTFSVLRQNLEDRLEELDYRFHEWAVDQMSGPQVWLLELVNQAPMKSTKDFDNFVARLNAFPKHMDQYLANLRDGLKSGRTAPQIAVNRVTAQLKNIATMTFEKSPFREALDKLKMEPKLPLESRLRDAFEKSVKPAFSKFLAFVEKDYAGRARSDADCGIWAIPGGADAYEFKIHSHTSAEYNAKRLHQIGLEELATLRAEMETIARKLGHDGDVKSFLVKLRKNPDNFHNSREDLLDGFRRILAKVDGKLPQYFGRLPRAGYEVRPIEEYREKDAPAAYYYQPDKKATRKGWFYANTYDLSARPKYNMAALAVHEAVPGHHLQVALSMELDHIPEFQRYGGFTAYVEGWALYSERLAIEMGVYESDLDRVGMLTFQMWRACRLVVDTGMHAMKWSRQKAIDFMKDNLALSETDISNEIDRYIIWPGQALAYMVGRREIERLRAESTRDLGPKFDIRKFHDAVLTSGAVPLETLNMIVKSWVERERGK